MDRLVLRGRHRDQRPERDQCSRRRLQRSGLRQRRAGPGLRHRPRRRGHGAHPALQAGGFVSAYQYLGERFGLKLQGWRRSRSSSPGCSPRAYAVRLAIPIKLLLDEFGLNVGYQAIIVMLTLITVVYTYLGGIKAVIWTDAIQMGLYLGGAILAIAVLSHAVGFDGYSQALRRHSSSSTPTSRSRTCSPAPSPADRDHRRRHLRDGQPRIRPADRPAHPGHPHAARGQKAMISSGIFVVSSSRRSPWSARCCRRTTRVRPSRNSAWPAATTSTRASSARLPVGISGLLVAGILGAAMGSLSSALNSMSNSTVSDIITASSADPVRRGAARLARVMTLVWAVLMASSPAPSAPVPATSTSPV